MIATFFVKERLREEWKTTSETVRMAAYIYSLHREASAQNARLIHLQKDLTALRSQVISVEEYSQGGKPDPDEESDTAFMQDFEERSLAMELLNARRINMTAFIDGLPPSTRLEEIRGLSAELNQVRAEGRSATNLQGTREDEVAIQNKDRDLTELEDKLDDRAERIVRKNETKETVAGLLSGVLYLLGWSLSLVGKLEHVQLSASEE